MADFNEFFPLLMHFEGGWANDPDDNGGPTKYGVILREWKLLGYDKDGDGDVDVEDLKKITLADAAKIAKPNYWDRIQGDNIHSQSIAEMWCDFAYNCGVITSIKKIQKLLGLKDDGVVGPVTLKTVNNGDSKVIFDLIKARREAYYRSIVADHPSQAKFLKGWLLRINTIKYKG